MTVTDIEMESCNSLCGCDQVRVYDGPDTDTDSFLNRFCCKEIPEPFWTTTNKATVMFRTDATTTYRGFSMDIEEAYPGRVETDIEEA